MGIFRRSFEAAEPARTFLGRLARDTRGNTLAIMGIAIIPLAGMVGGGVDISRMYILKTRMQHACDAGALAGRRAMGGGVWSYNSYYARTQANQFFDANIQNDAFGSSGMTRTFTENAGKVTGTASATLPMTLMRIFGRTTETIAVNCDAEMRLPNTDVMFVLDTTGSMSSSAGSDSMTKIQALKVAVKCFYEIVARLDTDATCTTGTPSGGTGDQVQIRFGFVPYSSNVNVGKLLPPAWFADSWNYQTREATYTTSNGWTDGTPSVTGTQEQNLSYSTWSNDTIIENSTQSQCEATPVPENTSFSSTGGESGRQGQAGPSGSPVRTTTWYTTQSGEYYQYRTSFNANNKRCRIQKRKVSLTLRRDYSQSDTYSETKTFSGWRYAQLPVNVGLLKDGTSWNSSFQWPIAANGANKTINWDGCIEERKTVKQSSYDPIPSDANDLNIDLVPTGDPDTQWGMVLRDVISTRGWTYNAFNSTSDYGNSSSYYCPTEAKLLQQWPDAGKFDEYVDSLTPVGNTYHDIGLIWGARLASPTGLFAATNAYTAKGGEIERHIIFMTDGDTNTSNQDYTAYGIPRLDRRTTPGTGEPSSANTDDQVDARFSALCAKIRNTNNFTLWVITFGSVTTDTKTRMTNCATPGRYFHASNAATLQSTFKSIADQISMLRLTH